MTNTAKRKKILDVLNKIRNYLDNGKYRFSEHATKRKQERFLSLPDVIEVLRNGHHEKAKDTWEEKYQSWNYAIRGKTADQKTCRIIVSIDVVGLLIITVICLDKELVDEN